MRSRDLTRDQIAPLIAMSDRQQRAFLKRLTPAEILNFDAGFETWAQKGQLPPRGEGWRVWLMMAGRGFGKTRAGAEWVHRLAMSAARRRIALVGATIDEARAVMVDGESGVVAVAARCGMKLKVSGRDVLWPNGSMATLYSGDSPEGLRGPAHHFAWCDELAKWREAEAAWNNLQFGLRIGPRPRALITTTPKPSGVINRIRQIPDMVETHGRTDDNLSLSPNFVEAMRRTYGGTRLERQELDGELIEDVEGSLWPRRLIERCRTTLPAGIERIVVGVDPPAGIGAGCDACGIVVAAKAGDKFYVLADESVQGLSPEGWARAVARAADVWGADRIVAEANNGGEMVRSCLIAAGASIRPKLVHASRGKVARAEPIAVRFEAGQAWFAGHFPKLEDELAGLSVGGLYDGPGRSPDRADAMVWALTELAEGKTNVPGIRLL